MACTRHTRPPKSAHFRIGDEATRTMPGTSELRGDNSAVPAPMPSKLLDHTSLTLVHLYGEAQGLDRAVEAVTVPGRKKAEAGRGSLRGKFFLMSLCRSSIRIYTGIIHGG